ncbi:MmgE/PrpD family protein [Advenella mimigardefordensis]|uniref:Putative 2-methylcitrate dehydratase PrpD n=1 Tax=Advenella mimigardefordensis (strain DSM 17166 / LMG 22922 / DPN7) TaxID=1247726 RepID=W0PG81_ADVMD|nr:MmgE/PrpD family protein [Advenella mimigardefordensis]AHG64103.1 putative 2-methylcitrate dehydratase PrpD [Advenella mimigardefordensis DPN7]
MKNTIIEQLAHYTESTTYRQLPFEVVHESKRILLDSIGCALAGLHFQKGQAGRDFARLMGSGGMDASIIGDARRVSIPAAAFANAELINTMDMDVVTVPGHVAPAVLSSIMAAGEAALSSGQQIIEAIAIGHEIGHRFGRAVDNLRDTKNGEPDPPKIFGYTSPIFGAAAGIAKLRGHSSQVIANGLGIAACISPVNSMMSWIHHAPATTIKYTLKGALAFQAVTAAYMAEFGHRGDVQVLDDAEYGYPRFIGSSKWEPDAIVNKLGEQWLFPAHTSYKPYPHCRVFNALLDCVSKIVSENEIKPDEIDSIKIFVEGFAQKPVWINRRIDDVHDAQFSMYHGIAVAAHGLRPGRAWLEPDFIQSPSVLRLMEKVSSEPHPDYVALLSGNAASRPARVELHARGETFLQERRFPKGSPSPEPDSIMTDAELIEKFRHNAQDVISNDAIGQLVESIMHLEQSDRWDRVVQLAVPTDLQK